MARYGQIKWAMPETFAVMAVICETAMLGSAGAVATTLAIPTKPLHCARPLPSTLGCPLIIVVDMPIGMGCVPNGLPMLQRTVGDMTVMGAMLNVPVAINCTWPLGNFCASAEDGVTISPCIIRVLLPLPFIIMELLPHPTGRTRAVP